MKNALFGLLFLAIPLTSSAQQTVEQILAQIRPGNYKIGDYGYIYGTQTPEYRVMIRGADLAVLDIANNIPYRLKVNSNVPQPLNDKFLQSLRARPATASVGSIIKSISLGDVRVGRKPGELLATVSIEIEYSSAFGSMSATVQMDAAAVVEKKKVYRYDQGKNIEYVVTTLDTYAGQNARLVKLDTNLGSTITRTLGLVADVVLRVGSLGLQSNDRLMEIRQAQ